MKDAPSQQEEVELTLYPITDKNDPTIKYYLKKYDDNSSKMTGVLYNYKAYKNNKTLIEYTFGLLITDSMNLIFFVFLFKIN